MRQFGPSGGGYVNIIMIFMHMTKIFIVMLVNSFVQYIDLTAEVV